MLGGAGHGREGRLQDVPPDSSVLGAVLDFAEASQRFRSRALRGRQNITPGTGHPRPCRGSKFVEKVIVHAEWMNIEHVDSGSLHVA